MLTQRSVQAGKLHSSLQHNCKSDSQTSWSWRPLPQHVPIIVIMRAASGSAWLTGHILKSFRYLCCVFERIREPLHHSWCFYPNWCRHVFQCVSLQEAAQDPGLLSECIEYQYNSAVAWPFLTTCKSCWWSRCLGRAMQSCVRNVFTRYAAVPKLFAQQSTMETIQGCSHTVYTYMWTKVWSSSGWSTWCSGQNGTLAIIQSNYYSRVH